MFLEEKQVMNLIINKIIHNVHESIQKYPRLQQWLWFIALWNLGWIVAYSLTYPIKIMTHFI
jgi:hypothetical protein